MKLLDKLKNGFIMLDGGMGTELQKLGLAAGELPEGQNLKNPDAVTEIHKKYLAAGSDVIATNPFGANILKFGEDLEQIISAAVKCAKSAVEEYSDIKPRFVGLDVGPLGKMLKPLGDLDFEDAVEIFAKTVKIGAKCGVDLIMIETMNDAYETKAAVLAAKENCDLPVFVTNVYDQSGKLMTGADPLAMVTLLEGLRVDALGLNCSLGPAEMKKIVAELLKYSSTPVIVKPNAGLPTVVDGKTVFNVTSAEFGAKMKEIADMGASVLGGCCGTNPEYILALARELESAEFKKIAPKNHTAVSSYTHGVTFEQKPILIGERINPTGKKRFKQALMENDMPYLLNEGVRQADAGVDILDVNVGLPEIDEVKMITEVIRQLQGVVDLPLQIDTVDYTAMEKAMRIYNGKPLINSVNGKQESMDKVFPLVKKYGGAVIAVTLDENGIPETAEGRVEIAEKIIAEAAKYGIGKNEIIVDPLAMAVSSNAQSANVTLKAVAILHSMGIKTSLGVSNVSFGLPSRPDANAAFYTMAMHNGLDCAIINPHSDEMMKAWYSFNALTGKDENFLDYIERFSSVEPTKKAESVQTESLEFAIEKGLKDTAYSIACKLLETQNPMDIIDGMIIPALNTVGKGFENKTVYLPQLLMSAEAAGKAFEAVKSAIPAGGAKKGKIIIATVKGDIHDIGKNIVKVLLENYGYEVTDLGKDVAPEEVVNAAKSNGIKLVGLSALMTTTVPAMEETIKLLRKELPDCRIMVGGAVMTPEYAEMIDADSFSPDAMGAVRYAETVFG